MGAPSVWVFVCNGAKAKAFEKVSGGDAWRVVWRDESADARKFTRELGRDRPARGRTIGTGEPFAIDAASLHERAEQDFILKCAGFLNAQAAQKTFDSMILADDPRALGVLQPLLGEDVAQRLKMVVNKDLTNLPTDKIAQAIDNAAL